MSKYDIIIGKVADDATNATLTAYIHCMMWIHGSGGMDRHIFRSCTRKSSPARAIKKEFDKSVAEADFVVVF